MISTRKKKREWGKRLLIYVLVSHLIVPNPSILYATGIEVDPNNPVTGVPTIDKAQNNVPVINIPKPTDGGVSSSKFLQYNVDPQGVVINNSLENGVSQLGGALYANPQFEGQSASTIMFEVTGTGQTSLNGFTEIFGSQANFILSNPNGIYTKEAGFINTPRATLTTGKAIWENNNTISGFDVDQGTVVIDGFNGSNIEAVDIIARAVEINEALYSQDKLIIIAGRNTVNYANNQATAKVENGTPKPSLAIDAKALGAMKSGSVYVISTEHGVGVNMEGSIEGRAGNVEIDSNGDIVVKQITAKQDINLTGKGNITQNGKSQAEGSINYESEQDISIQGEGLIANDSLSLIASQNIRVTGTSAQRTSLDAKVVTVSAGNTLTIEETNAQASRLMIDSDGNIVVASASVEAVNTLNVTAKNLINDGKMISGGTAEITVSETVTNNSRLSAKNSLTVSANETVNNGQISSGGTTQLNGGSVTNNSLIFGLTHVGTDLSGTLTNNEGNILSMGTASLNADVKIRNDLGTIESDGAMRIKTGRLENVRAGTENVSVGTMPGIERRYIKIATGEVVKESQIDTTGLIYGSQELWDSEGGHDSLYIKAYREQTGTNIIFNTEYPVYTTRYEEVRDYTPYEDRVVLNEVRELSDEEGVISAGGDLSIETDYLYNDASLIKSGGDIQLRGGILDNASHLLTKEVGVGYMLKNKYDEEHYCHGSFGTSCDWHDRYQWESRTRTELDNSTKTPARILAKGTITTDMTVKNGGERQEGHSYSKEVDPSTETNAVTEATNIALPTGEDGLFKRVSIPTDGSPAPNYLIETNVSFIDMDQFLSSEYLLKRIGVDLESATLIGDAYYQTYLVKKQLAQKTQSAEYFNRDLLTMDTTALMAKLYDGAIEANKSMDIAIGVALTAEQQDVLTQDMVWLVEKEVDGQKVFVPELYLAKLGQDELLPDGSIISASDIRIETNGEVANSGSIVADNQVSVSAKQIENDGGTIQGNKVGLEAEEDIVNTVGRIKGTEDVTLTAGRDIRNEALVSRNGHDGSYQYEVEAASIESGGTLKLRSGRDIINRGSRIGAGGNAQIESGGDILIESVQLASGSNDVRKQVKASKQSGASMDIKGNLDLKAKGDMTVIASDVSVGKNANLDIDGSLNLLSALDRKETKQTRYEDKGWGSKKTTTNKTERSSVASNFTVGGDADIQTGEDITLQGSQLEIDGNGRLDTGGSINLLSAYNTTRESITEEKSGFFYEGGSTTDKLNKTAVSSGIKAGGSLTAKADDSILLHGSKMEAGDRLDMEAENGIGILTAENISDTKKSSWNKMGFWASNKSEERNSKVDQIGSDLTSGADFSMISKGDIQIIGSKLTTGGDAVIDAADDLTIASAVESEYSYKMEEDNRFAGFSLSTTRSSASLNMNHIGSRSTEESTDITQQASVFDIGGKFTTRSGKDTTVMGSDITAVSDIDMKADGDMNILSAEEIQEEIEKDTQIKETVSLTIGNAWIESAYSAQDTLNAGKAAYKTGQKVDTSTKEGRANKAAADAQLALSAMRLANSSAQLAGAAAFGGFHISTSVSRQEKETQKTRKNQTSQGSRIKSQQGNINLTAKDTLSIEGSAVVAQQGDIALEGTDVKILAKENQSSESWSSRETNTSHELFNTSGSTSLPTHGQSDEKGGSNASNYSHSYVGANGNLSIKSKNDTTVKGALVEGGDVDLDIGGDLTVASVQNTGTGQSDSEGYSLGGTTGYNTGESNADRNWTDTQTHIIGTNQLDIKAEKLSLEGALLANAEIERNKEGFITNLTDKGNLKIKVNTLEIKGLKDSDEGSNQAYGVNVSGFTGYPQIPQGGSTQLNAQTSGHKKKGHTRATIGKGEIVTKQTTLFTADPTQTEINRDLGKRQEVTEDKTTGGLDISLDIDNRLATDTGNYVADSVVNGLNVFGNGVKIINNIKNEGHAQVLDLARKMDGKDVVNGGLFSNSEVDRVIDSIENGEDYKVGSISQYEEDTIYNPQNIVAWHRDSTGKFHIEPRYGNYAGGGWTGGSLTVGLDESKWKEPIDKLDASAKNHDKGYADNDYYEADKQFVEELWSMDVVTGGVFGKKPKNPAKAYIYKVGALSYFGPKVFIQGLIKNLRKGVQTENKP